MNITLCDRCRSSSIAYYNMPMLMENGENETMDLCLDCGKRFMKLIKEFWEGKK